MGLVRRREEKWQYLDKIQFIRNFMEQGYEMEKLVGESQIEIEQTENDQEALNLLTEDLFEAIRKCNESDQERFTVLLPAGRAAEKLFVILRDRLSEIDFSKVHFIQAEQLWPIPKDHPVSLLGGMEKALLEGGISEENIHEFDSEAENEEDATREVQEALCFGIDYAIAGLNASGAIAGLRDGEEFRTKHIDMVNLDLKSELISRDDLGMTDLPYRPMEELVRLMYEKYWPNDPENGPARMFAPGWKYMIEARKLAILGTGASKKEAIQVALANTGVEIPIKDPENNLIDVIMAGKRDIDDQKRHLTSTGEIALSRRKNQLPTKIYTDYPIK